MMRIVSLYDTKTHLSVLVTQAAAGAEIVIAEDRVPQARQHHANQPHCRRFRRPECRGRAAIHLLVAQARRLTITRITADRRMLKSDGVVRLWTG